MSELLTSAEGQVLSKPGASYKYYIIITASLQGRHVFFLFKRYGKI